MTGPGIPVPLVPERPLRWQGIPLFHVGAFPKDFSGKLFFVLGQGLGDHLNGFRLVHEIQKRFSRATCVVFADLRWEELVRRIEGIEIRWYPKASDVLSKTGTNNPYDSAHAEVRKETESFPGRAFLAYAHFPMPDRHARLETTLEATARTIALPLKDMARPYLPVLSSDLEWAEKYLKEHHLEKGKYAVIAPFSWPNKIWAKENFSSLIDGLYHKHGIRSVVASYPEIGPFDNEGVVCAFDLTLGHLTGLMSQAGLYVGLDSGPSHMAAFFDLPMVVVFVEKKVIPFEVRPLSPHALYVVESFFSPVPVPNVTTVTDAVSFLMESGEGKKIPNCPVCGRSMNNVVLSNGCTLRLMCSCGLTLDQKFLLGESRWGISADFPREQDPEIPEKGSLKVNQEISSFLFLEKWGEATKRTPRETVDVDFDDQSVGMKNILTPTRIQWGLDPLIFWMGSRGYRVGRVFHAGGNLILSFSRGMGDVSSSLAEDPLGLPWGRLHLSTTYHRYLRWFSFERWADPKILVGIVKSLKELGFPRRERVACAWVAFRADPSIRSFRWLFKGFF